MSLKKIVFVGFSVAMIIVMYATVVTFFGLPPLVRTLLGAAVAATLASSLLHYYEREQKKQRTSLKPNSNT